MNVEENNLPPTSTPNEPPTPTSETPPTETPKPEGEPEAAPTEFVPLTAESITIPEVEGFTLDEGLRDEFLGIVNNQELEPAARAQALVDLHLKTLQQASEAGSKGWEETQTQWQEQTRADPEIGGDKLDGVLATVGKAVEAYGSQELRDAMDLTGAGNNPHIIKFIYNMAKQFNEGGPVSGNPSGEQKSLAERMFPSMKGS